APWTSLGPSDRRTCRILLAGWLNGTRCGVPFLVRVAGIVQVAKSSESSAHVIPATSSRRWPVSVNRRTIPKGWATWGAPVFTAQSVCTLRHGSGHEVSTLFPYRFVDTLLGLFPIPC